MRGERVVGERPGRRPGLLMKSLTSHPAYYRQKTAAEAKVGRALTNEEFERDFWREPDSTINSANSIFDPVLCELVYRWFCPPAGIVLDPFAGGSVRGIVASKLGRPYVGVDLSERQIIANEEQSAALCDDPVPIWKCGDSQSLAKLVGKDFQADFVFSCPPYANLEVYSDDPRDLSRMDYSDFRAAYASIIAAACAKLRDDRFACFVVGDVRDKQGFYCGFPWHTVQAFEDAGARLYNEAVLVTQAGSLPVLAGRIFEASRKLGKTHQNVLVFCKGDPRKARAALGPVEFGEISEEFGEEL